MWSQFSSTLWKHFSGKYPVFVNKFWNSFASFMFKLPLYWFGTCSSFFLVITQSLGQLFAGSTCTGGRVSFMGRGRASRHSQHKPMMLRVNTHSATVASWGRSLRSPRPLTVMPSAYISNSPSSHPLPANQGYSFCTHSDRPPSGNGGGFWNPFIISCIVSLCSNLLVAKLNTYFGINKLYIISFLKFCIVFSLYFFC